MVNNKGFVLISLIVSILSAVYFSIFFLKEVWLLFFISGILSFFYVWKIPGLKGKNLRDVTGIKIYIIGIVWVLITVFVPFFVDSNSDLNRTVILFLSELLFMISITIPFDIRDISLDEASKKTIPQLIGVKKSVHISIALLIISQIMMQFLMPSLNIGTWLLTVATIVILQYSHPKRKELYFSGLIDGLLILQPVLLYLFNL